jgi:hypothetical protein
MTLTMDVMDSASEADSEEVYAKLIQMGKAL